MTGSERPGSSVGTSVRLKSGRSPVRPRPWPQRTSSSERAPPSRVGPFVVGCPDLVSGSGRAGNPDAAVCGGAPAAWAGPRKEGLVLTPRPEGEPGPGLPAGRGPKPGRRLGDTKGTNRVRGCGRVGRHTMAEPGSAARSCVSDGRGRAVNVPTRKMAGLRRRWCRRRVHGLRVAGWEPAKRRSATVVVAAEDGGAPGAASVEHPRSTTTRPPVGRGEERQPTSSGVAGCDLRTDRWTTPGRGGARPTPGATARGRRGTRWGGSGDEPAAEARSRGGRCWHRRDHGDAALPPVASRPVPRPVVRSRWPSGLSRSTRPPTLIVSIR